jgi:hypothetical protein
VRQCAPNLVVRCNSSPKDWAYFDVAHCRRRENASHAIATVERVRHDGDFGVSRKAEKNELLAGDPPELDLSEGEGLNHRDCEEREPGG